ncbi:MAG TPA: glycosyltransferase [Anaerolineae bacterium]
MSIQVSVVVPTYKRPRLLTHCLAALLMQDFDPDAYEVIVVDDAASEETKRVVEAWNDYPELKNNLSLNGGANGYRHLASLSPPNRTTHTPNSSTTTRKLANSQTCKLANSQTRIRYIPVTRTRGPAAARNCGWRAAHGQIIAFTDDDCIPQPDWLRAGVLALTHGAVGAAGRLVVPVQDVPTDYELNMTHMQNARFLTANCFYWREALDEVGGFDERFTLAWREDSDLYFTLLKQYGNSRFIRAPEAVVIHPPRPPVHWGISLSQQRKSMYNALLYKKHPNLYWTMIQPCPPWRYYHIVAAMLIGLSGALSGHKALALIALTIWLLLTSRFCWQRLRYTSRAPSHVAEMIVTSILIPPLSIFWRLFGALKFRVPFL